MGLISLPRMIGWVSYNGVINLAIIQYCSCRMGGRCVVGLVGHPRLGETSVDSLEWVDRILNPLFLIITVPVYAVTPSAAARA